MKNVEVLTVKEVAEMLKLSEHTIRMKVYRSQLPARRLGGRIVFLKDELEAYLRNLPKAVPELREARRRRMRQAKPSK